MCQPVDRLVRARDHLPVECRGDHEEAILVHRASLLSGQTHKVHGPYQSLLVCSAGPVEELSIEVTRLAARVLEAAEQCQDQDALLDPTMQLDVHRSEVIAGLDLGRFGDGPDLVVNLDRGRPPVVGVGTIASLDAQGPTIIRQGERDRRDAGAGRVRIPPESAEGRRRGRGGKRPDCRLLRGHVRRPGEFRIGPAEEFSRETPFGAVREETSLEARHDQKTLAQVGVQLDRHRVRVTLRDERDRVAPGGRGRVEGPRVEPPHSFRGRVLDPRGRTAMASDRIAAR